MGGDERRHVDQIQVRVWIEHIPVVGRIVRKRRGQDQAVAGGGVDVRQPGRGAGGGDGAPAGAHEPDGMPWELVFQILNHVGDIDHVFRAEPAATQTGAGGARRRRSIVKIPCRVDDRDDEWAGGGEKTAVADKEIV